MDDCKALPLASSSKSLKHESMVLHAASTSPGSIRLAVRKGRTLLNFATQRKRFLWHRRCI